MTGKARTITELITYSVTNPPEHSNCVVVVDRDPSNKTELITAPLIFKGKDGSESSYPNILETTVVKKEKKEENV